MQTLVTTSFKIGEDSLAELKDVARELSVAQHEDISVGAILRSLVADYLAEHRQAS